MFCYKEGKTEKPEFFVPYSKMNATKAYLGHYDNFLYLSFILNNPLSTQAEKRQANREIAICDRKLNWWAKHPNLDKAAVGEGKRLMHQKWRSK